MISNDCWRSRFVGDNLYTSRVLPPSEHIQQSKLIRLLIAYSGFELRPSLCSVFVSFDFAFDGDGGMFRGEQKSLYTSRVLPPSEHTQQFKTYSTINRLLWVRASAEPVFCFCFIDISLVSFVWRMFRRRQGLNL